ncbi:MAG: hypothetical protein HY525_11250 [Betaproteobacteria bacterium]|nr:hypothetical protein [Betaproteobacteria bacterium]
MSTIDEDLKELKRVAPSGGLAKASTDDLERYAAALCDPGAFTAFQGPQFPQIAETVRLHLLRAHIARLQGHITNLDAKNTKLQWWVIALAVAALIGTVIQATVAIRAEARAELQSRLTEPIPATPAAPNPASTPAQSPLTRPTAPAAK